jgi:hypothetical protein
MVRVLDDVPPVRLPDLAGDAPRAAHRTPASAWCSICWPRRCGLAVFGHFGALVFGSRSGGSSTFPEVPFSLSGGAPNHVGARLADYLDRLSRILSVSDVTPSGARVYAAVAVDLKHDASGKSVKPSGGTMR